MMRWTFMLVALVPSAFGSPLRAQELVWRDATSNYEIKAKFVSFADDSVTLRSSDGAQITVPVEKLDSESALLAKVLGRCGADLLTRVASADRGARLTAINKVSEEPIVPSQFFTPLTAFIDFELAYLATSRDRPDNAGEPITEFPELDGLTSLVRLKGDSQRFIGQSIEVVGSVSPSSFYSYAYDDAEDTHFSFTFRERNSRGDSGETAFVYAPKLFGRFLVELATDANESDSEILIHAKLKIDPDHYGGASTWDELELQDWRIYKGNGQWTNWALAGFSDALRAIARIENTDALVEVLTSREPLCADALVTTALRLQIAEALHSRPATPQQYRTFIARLLDAEMYGGEIEDGFIRRAIIAMLSQGERLQLRRLESELSTEYSRARRRDDGVAMKWADAAYREIAKSLQEP